MIVQMNDITKIYSEVTPFKALENIDLSIKQGEFIILLGPSGCGKTTLLNIIGLMDRFSEGQYLFLEKDVKKLSFDESSKLRNQKIGFVFQSYFLMKSMKVWENVAVPLGYAGVSKKERMSLSYQALTSTRLLDQMNKYPNQLSGGQKQRVAIARAIVSNPKLLIADEPTGNLDSVTTNQIMQLLLDIHKKDTTIIMSTHNNQLIKYATRVIEMFDGKIVKDSQKG